MITKTEIKKAMKIAGDLLKDLNGEISLSTHNYELFKFKCDGVQLLFYPYQSPCRNYHIRVRDQGSKNKEKATKTMFLLEHHFRRKNTPYSIFLGEDR